MGSQVLGTEYELHRDLMNAIRTLGLDGVGMGVVFAQSLKGIQHYGLESHLNPDFDTWSEVLCELADALALATAYHTRRCAAGLDVNADSGKIRQRVVDHIRQAMIAVVDLAYHQREWKKWKKHERSGVRSRLLDL